jgi:PAS domain S-box-containing protein
MRHDERREAAEAQLQPSEQRFHVAVESMLDSLTIVSPVRDAGGEIIDFRHKYLNSAYCALVGFEREQLLDHRLGELFPEFPGSDRFAVYRRVAETGEACRTDEIHGEQAWAGTQLAARVIDTIISPIGDDLVVSARDVTERKRAEQELRLRAERLDLVHDAAIVRDPADSRVRFWNREAEAMYGYSREEALGRVMHELLATVFPESRASVDDALAREGRWEGELRHARKDGEVIVVSSRQVLQRSDDGRPIAIITLNSDITERKRIEKELAHATRLLELTQAISKTGGWEYEIETGKRLWTDELYRIHGLERTPEPPDITKVIAAFDPDGAPIIEAAYRRLIAEGEPYDLELGLIRPDGERIWVHAIGRPVIERGRVVRVAGTISDVTDRRRAQEEIRTLNAELEQRVAQQTEDLRASNQELEALVYSVSHDLRAPLRAMSGFSSMLLADYAEQVDERGQHYLSRVRAGAQRMGTMIEQLLQLSRVSRAELRREPIDLSDLARQIADELQTAEPERQVEFAIADRLTAEGDRELVRIVLENLLGNAWKFTSTREHARIEIAGGERDDRSEFVVRDNGVGFDMEHAGQLFKAFQRLHRADEFPGTGIGLASVQRIIARHGGQISAHSEIGRGATFTFTLERTGDAT